MAYTRIDRLIARQRFRAAYPHVSAGSRVCDLGCGLEAAFLNYAADRVSLGIGVDDQVEDCVRGLWQFVHADLSEPFPFPDGHFDHVVMLAVLEHLTQPEIVLREAHRILAPSGSLILTWPSAVVDPILHLLRGMRLISNEMESDQHQRRIPVAVLRPMLQQIGFRRFFHRYFECRLNNLLVAYR